MGHDVEISQALAALDTVSDQLVQLGLRATQRAKVKLKEKRLVR